VTKHASFNREHRACQCVSCHLMMCSIACLRQFLQCARRSEFSFLLLLLVVTDVERHAVLSTVNLPHPAPRLR